MAATSVVAAPVTPVVVAVVWSMTAGLLVQAAPTKAVPRTMAAIRDVNGVTLSVIRLFEPIETSIFDHRDSVTTTKAETATSTAGES